MLLGNRVAIITGGAKGIGRGIALKFAEEGCSVAIADLLEKEAPKTAEEISGKGVEGFAVQCDATNGSQVQKAVEKVVNKFGKIDILVNNAGGLGPIQPTAAITEEQWDKMLTLNLKGMFLFSKAIIPHMVKKKYGKIVNISSLAATFGCPPQSHYAAAKGGVLSFSIALANELAGDNICVNAILPGIIRTGLWDVNVPPGVTPDEFFRQLGNSSVPMKRAGTPEDVALVALFFASELSRYVTGDRLYVGGGLPLQPPPTGAK